MAWEVQTPLDGAAPSSFPQTNHATARQACKNQHALPLNCKHPVSTQKHTVYTDRPHNQRLPPESPDFGDSPTRKPGQKDLKHFATDAAQNFFQEFICSIPYP